MIAHNNQFNEHVESATSTAAEPGIGEYRDWASQLSHLAEQVRDPALAERATTLANLAQEQWQSLNSSCRWRAGPQPSFCAPAICSGLLADRPAVQHKSRNP